MDGVALITNEFKRNVNKRKECTYHKNELYFLCPTPLSCSRMENCFITFYIDYKNLKFKVLSLTHIYNPKIPSPIEITTIAILSTNLP